MIGLFEPFPLLERCISVVFDGERISATGVVVELELGVFNCEDLYIPVALFPKVRLSGFKKRQTNRQSLQSLKGL